MRKVELNSYLLDHLINFLLPHEQQSGGKNTLEEFFSYTLIDPSDSLVFYDREHAIECGLILDVTCLEPALYNTKIHGEDSYPTASGMTYM